MRKERSGLRNKVEIPSEDLSIEEIKKGIIPAHVAIIMDGNGRWAKERKRPRLFGHMEGAKAIRRVVEVAPEVGVKYLTLYAFSIENWRRPKEEVSGLMKLFEDQLAKEIDELDRNGVRIRVLGRINELPETTRLAFINATERTKNNSALNLNLALNYGGRAEIIDAARKICNSIIDGKLTSGFSEEEFARHLYTSEIPDPELLIRTSGELRISNFLLWQIAYAEIWITDKLWPDFEKRDFLQATSDFQNRRRRFGGVDED